MSYIAVAINFASKARKVIDNIEINFIKLIIP